MKVYYAHSKKIYGSVAKKAVIKILDRLYADVVDPEQMGELGKIDPYLRAIDECDEVVCTEYNEHIGRGVYDEVQHALSSGKSVYLFRRNEFVVVLGVRSVDPNDWAVCYGKLVTDVTTVF